VQATPVEPIRVCAPVTVVRAQSHDTRGPRVALGTVDGQVIIIDEQAWCIEASVRAHSSCVTDLTFTPDGTLYTTSFREMFSWII
jgi:WD40 repeat protein